MRTLKPSDYTRMRWRNGRGETAMIACGAPDGDDGPHRWRLSLATMTEDGPFSRFPEYERILMVVAGAGIRLTGPDSFLPSTVMRGKALQFSGALDLQCRLLDGPVANLNLMFVPGTQGASVTLLPEDRPSRFSPAPGRSVLIHCASGGAGVRGPSGMGRIEAGETLWLGSADNVEARPGGSRPTLLATVSVPD